MTSPHLIRLAYQKTKEVTHTLEDSPVLTTEVVIRLRDLLLQAAAHLQGVENGFRHGLIEETKEQNEHIIPPPTPPH